MLSSNYRFVMVFMLIMSLMFFLMNALLNFNKESYFVDLNLVSISSVYISISIIVDYLSLSFSFVVMGVSSCVFLFAVKYMMYDKNQMRFMLNLMLFVLSMNVLVFSGSLIMLMIGWDGLGVSSFILIIHYLNKNSLFCGMLTLLTNRIGDVFLMITLIFMFTQGQITYNFMNNFGMVLFLFYYLSSITKSAQYPFSAWLPAAMAAPTPVSALVHSSTLVTAGVFILIRLSNLFNSYTSINSFLLFSGSMTCILGGLSACYENDIKKVVAFSTLSQLGLMMYSIGLGYSNLALIHLYTHAMFKSMMFLAAGFILISCYGTQDLRLMSSSMVFNPFLAMIFNTSNFCLMGLPFLSSFYSKHCIYEVTYLSSMNTLSFVLMLLGTLLTGLYSGRLMIKLMWKKSNTLLISKLSSIDFIPCFFLFCMSILSGKYFFNNSLLFIESVIVHEGWGLMVTFLPGVGFFLGLMLITRNSNEFLVKMFLLWPASFNLRIISSSLAKYTSALDQGWLEPNLMKFYPVSLKFFNFIYQKETYIFNLLWGSSLFILMCFIFI